NVRCTNQDSRVRVVIVCTMESSGIYEEMNPTWDTAPGSVCAVLCREQLPPQSWVVARIHVREIEGPQRFDLILHCHRCPVTVHHVCWHQPKGARTDARGVRRDVRSGGGGEAERPRQYR